MQLLFWRLYNTVVLYCCTVRTRLRRASLEQQGRTRRRCRYLSSSRLLLRPYSISEEIDDDVLKLLWKTIERAFSHAGLINFDNKTTKKSQALYLATYCIDPFRRPCQTCPPLRLRLCRPFWPRGGSRNIMTIDWSLRWMKWCKSYLRLLPNANCWTLHLEHPMIRYVISSSKSKSLMDDVLMDVLMDVQGYWPLFRKPSLLIDTMVLMLFLTPFLTSLYYIQSHEID